MKPRYKTLLLFFTLFNINNLFGQETHEFKLHQLYSILNRGQIKVADFNLTKSQEDLLISRGSEEGQELSGLVNFFKENLGLKGVIITEEQRKQVYNQLNSYCEIIDVSWSIGSFKSQLGAVGYYPFTIKFGFCDGTELMFDTPINVTGLTRSMSNAIRRSLDKSFLKPTVLNQPDLLNLKTNDILFRDSTELIKYFNDNLEKKPLEGIYQQYSVSGLFPIKKFGLIFKNGKYLLVNLSTNFLHEDWKFGETIGELNPSKSNKIITGKIQNVNKKSTDATLIFIDENLLELEWYGNLTRFRFVKVDL